MIRKIVKKSVAVLLVILTLLSNIIAVSAAEISGGESVDLSEYSDVISNEELGYLYSYSGYVSKEDYAASLKSDGSVSASIHPTFSYCYDSSGNVITVRKSMASQAAGENALLIKVNGARVYCIEPGEHLYSDSNISSAEAYAKLDKDVRLAINVALCFGWEGNTLSADLGNGKKINEYQGYLATQLIIWEIVKGQRSAEAPYALNSGCSGYLDMFCAGGYNSEIKTAYNRIVSGMSKYCTLPSFTTDIADSAPTYSLYVSYDNRTNEFSYSSQTLTDANGVLSNYKALAGTYNVGNATVKVTVSGNKLTMSCSNASLSATSSTVTLKAEKSGGIPTTSQGKLITYGSSTVQDVVGGGKVDPPNAYMKIRVVVFSSNTKSSDGYISKTCWSEDDVEDDDVDEDEGLFNTAANRSGWYFYVKVSSRFKNYFNYKKDYIILGPTDETGKTQTINEYIKENINSNIDVDEFDLSGVQESFEYYELGRLRSGYDGDDLENDYYMPTNISSYSGATYSNYLAGSTNINTLRVDQKSSNTYCVNVVKIPFRLIKINEDGASTKGFYFTATNQETGDVYTLGIPVSQGYARVYGDNSLYTSFVDEDNFTVYNNYLPEGTYTIHELGKKNKDGTYSLPEQYDEISDFEVEISADALKTAQDAGLDAIEVTMTNTTSSYIAVEKKDKDTQSLLSGAVYGIYSDSSCLNLLESITTDENGYAQSEKKYGVETYYMKEITPPTNYKSNDTIYTVDVEPTSNADNVVKVEAEDEHETGYAAVHKTDSKTGSSLKGATYGLYSDSSCTELLESAVTGDDGIASFTEAYKTGTTYYVKEIKAPAGYTVSSKVYDIIITSDNTSTDTAVLAEVSDSPTVTTVSKTDITGSNEISGAHLKITDKDGSTVDSWVSGSTPHSIYNLVIGSSYTLTETQPADGYTTAESITFTVTESGTTSVVMKDAPTSVEFVKVDDSGSLISGVKLQVLDSSKNVVEEWTTDGKTNHQIVGTLTVGKTYYLHEVSAPSDYELSDDVPFTVKDTADVQTVTMTDIRRTGSVKVIKQDEDGNGLSGSKWQLYTSDGTRVKVVKNGSNSYSYDTSGTVVTMSAGDTDNVTVTGLPIGSYYLIESESPDEYMPYGEKITFSISAGSTSSLNKTITVKDNRITMLDTGGCGYGGLTCIGCITFLLAALGFTVIVKKSRKHD